jgi:hypothetical protein
LNSDLYSTAASADVEPNRDHKRQFARRDAIGRSREWLSAIQHSQCFLIKNRRTRTSNHVFETYPPFAVNREGDLNNPFFAAGARFSGIALEPLDVDDKRTLPVVDYGGRGR